MGSSLLSTSDEMTIDFTNLREYINPDFYKLFGNTSRYLIMVGGAGSGKSFFASQKIVVRCLMSKIRFIVLRKVARTNRQSTFKRIQNQINMWGLSSLVRVNKTDMTMSFSNGSEIIFLGVDDPEKLKSLEQVDSIWIEEATEMSEHDFEQIDLRMRGKSNTYRQILLTFNPISSFHWLKKKFFMEVIKDGQVEYQCSDPNGHIYKSTYKNNSFIDDIYAQKIERMRITSPELYKIYGEGLWGVLKGLIYSPPILADKFPTHFDKQLYGLDFGFNHPTCLLHFGTKDFNPTTKKGYIYVTEKIYQSDLTTPDLAALMKELNVSKTHAIYADPAEPDRINELRKHGFNVQRAKKGQGSVNAGIDFVKACTIVSKESNTNYNNERSTYCWEYDDISGEYLDTPVGLNDHAMDAERYALFTRYGKGVAHYVSTDHDVSPSRG